MGKVILVGKAVNADNEIIGCSVFIESVKEVKFYNNQSLIEILRSNPNFIEGLKECNNELKGTNGSLSRYTTIDCHNNVIGKQSLVVLRRIGNDKIQCVNHAGVQSIIYNDQAIEYANKNGIANGKIITKDGKQILSSIIGEYDYIDDTVKIDESALNLSKFIDGINSYLFMIRKKYQNFKGGAKLIDNNTKIKIITEDNGDKQEFTGVISNKEAIIKVNIQDINFEYIDTIPLKELLGKTTNIQYLIAEEELFQLGINCATSIFNKLHA